MDWQDPAAGQACDRYRHVSAGLVVLLSHPNRQMGHSLLHITVAVPVPVFIWVRSV